MLRFIFFVRFECANSIWRVWVLTCKSRNITPLGIVATLTRPQEFKRIVKWRVFSRLLQSKKNFYCCFCEIQSTFNIFIHISLRNNINIRGKQPQLEKKDNNNINQFVYFFGGKETRITVLFNEKIFYVPGIYGNTEGKTDLRLCQRSNTHFEYQGKHKFAICWTCFARTDWQFKSRWNLKRFYSDNVLSMSTMELAICNFKLREWFSFNFLLVSGLPNRGI